MARPIDNLDLPEGDDLPTNPRDRIAYLVTRRNTLVPEIVKASKSDPTRVPYLRAEAVRVNALIAQAQKDIVSARPIIRKN
jgi:hypothetical protein